MMVYDWFKKWADYAPDKIALKEYETGKTITFSELNRRAEQFSDYLCSSLDYKKGDRLAVLSENCIDLVALLGVTQKRGIILCPLNYRLASPEIQHLIEQLEPKAVLCEDKFIEKITIKQAIPILDFASLSALQKKTASISLEVNEEDTALIIFTSGTTGKPKGCLYTHKMMLWNSINTALRLDLNSSDRSINCAPPFHTGGWNVLLTPFLHHGAFTLLMRSFDPSSVLNCINKEKLSVWWAVPTMLKMLSSAPEFSSITFPDLRYLIVGGEALPLDVIDTWHQKGVPIRQGYGLTEVGPNVTSLNQEDAIRKQGSIGKLNFYYNARLVHEDGHDVEAGESGELWLSGPCVSPGYWRIPTSENKDLVNGWFKTGDVLKMDKEGFLFVVDRIKHMYISGGENVYPAEVEKILLQHPNIQEAAIVGIPHAKWGETGKAYIVWNTHLAPDTIALENYCEEKLAKFKIPGEWAFVESLPKTDSGKIDRKQLKILSKS
jgi:fatty-acyl-CoA synthase